MPQKKTAAPAPAPATPIPTNWALVPAFLTDAEAAAILRISPRSVIRYRNGYTNKKRGTSHRQCLDYIRRKSGVLIPKASLEKFLNARVVAA